MLTAGPRPLDHAVTGADRAPGARGPLSAWVLDAVSGRPSDPLVRRDRVTMAIDDDDAQLALWLLEITAVADIAGVDPAGRREVEPVASALRDRFEERLRELVPTPEVEPGELWTHLESMRTPPPADDSAAATADEVLATFAAKAPYLGWEADPHTLMLAVIEPELKTPIATIQAGEYGVGHGRPHAGIYRDCLEAVGMTVADAVDAAPAAALAFANCAWLFARRRHLRGASVGQLCFLEIDSVDPCRARAADWDRAGLPDAGRRWYDVHVLADAEHQDVVRHQLVPAIEEHTPWLVPDAIFGAEVTRRLQSWPA